MSGKDTGAPEGPQSFSVDEGAAGIFNMLPPEDFDEVPVEADEEVTDPAHSEADEEDESETEGNEEDDSTPDGEEDSESDEEEDEADDEEEDEADDEEQPVYEVKVDGETVEVTFEELLNGYSRTSDYTRKTQQLAKEREETENLRTAFKGETEQLVAVRGQYVDRLKEVESILDAYTAEPDWAKIQKEQPEKFAAIHAQWQVQKQHLDQIKQARLQAETEQSEAKKALDAETVRNEQRKLVEIFPEWKEPAVFEEEAQKISQYLQSLGFDKKDIDKVVDHRLVKIFRNSMLYEQAQSKKPRVKGKTKQPKTSKPLPPGSRKGQTKKGSSKSNIEKARARVQKTGSVDDAAAGIFEILDD